ETDEGASQRRRSAAMDSENKNSLSFHDRVFDETHGRPIHSGPCGMAYRDSQCSGQQMKTPPDKVPALRPLLPPADRLLPYLRRIDAARTYTNWGPLACELERRLCAHFDVPDKCVISAGSGTAALVGAILATAGRAKKERPF